MIDSFELDSLHTAMEEEFNRVAGVEGWKLHDTPMFSPENMERFIAIAGDDNVKVMAGSSGTLKGEPWVRASLLLSPEAVRRCREYTEALGDAPTPEA